ncbi:hypothetical protein MPSEU_000439200 [Mayamaea pseudoterrestris]|nr:hypothetical protein MPSEU_000439200 [Mayamaea pseudoterrestris]
MVNSNIMPQLKQSPVSNRVSLEQKLELLEARFTEPYDSDTPTLNSPHMQVHSFGFDTPVLMGSSNNSNTGSRSNLSTSLHEVNLAAARQMVKVAGGDSVLEADASNASTHTLITAHLSSKQQQQQQQQQPSPSVVQISESPSPPTNGSNEAETSGKNKRKRKPANPVKFDLPSVKENLGGKTIKVETNAPAKDNSKKAEARKRSRAAQQQAKSAEATMEAAVVAPVTNDAVAPTDVLPATSPTTNSRDSKKRNTTKGPTNNRLISNFFKPSSTKANVPLPVDEPPLRESTLPRALIPANATTKPISSTASGSDDRTQLQLLQRHCTELEQTLKETTEQLSAIRNHRSILHANLTVSLERCQNQLATAKQMQAQEVSRLMRVVEESIRKQAEQDAAAVRANLAVNGARLGQIVIQRVGMRTVEVWQDGQATKTLLETKSKLKKERNTLELRKEAAKKAWERVSRGNCNDESEIVGGIAINSRLEAAEALESVEYHLSDVSRREQELIREEQALNLEKAAHVRGLKRVNSEDNSRFRSRPKLHDRYVLQSLLGKGGFSEVWKAYDLVELCDVAVKIHQLDPRWSDSKKENYTKHISREYEIHKNVRHPRIVSLFDVFEIDINSFATVLECCGGGDLDVLLKERKSLAERDARAILFQILLGMQYLSQPSADGARKGIIHYDLKPGNILFDVAGDAKITDFGLSKIVDTVDSAESMELTSQGAGTYWYLPPECFVTDDNVRISSKVDVWSIGTIYYQMLYGRRPFGEGQSQDRILKDQTMLNAHHVHFPDQPQVSEQGKEFIQACLTYEQSLRPNIVALCEHAYLFKQL